MKKIILILRLVLLLMVASISIPSDSWSQICGPGNVGDTCGGFAGCGCKVGLECVLENPNFPDSAGVCQGPEIPPSSSLGLNSPPDGEQTDPVTVFRWTRSDNPAVSSYRLKIATDQNMEDVVLNLPELGGEKIIAPQVAVDLRAELDDGVTLYWRVIGLDQAGDPVEQSEEVFSFSFFIDPRGFTVITGLVKSDLNQAALVGAQVAVSSASHAFTDNSIVATEFNGEYIVIALTTDGAGDAIPFPIEITSTKEGFNPTTEILQESDRQNGVITRDVVMSEVIPPSDSIELISPGCKPTEPDPPCATPEETDPVTVFRWTRSDNPAVSSYRLIIATNENMTEPVLDLPKPGDKSIIAPQVVVRLGSPLLEGQNNPFFWRVIALDESEKFVEESQIFWSWYQTFERDFTVISGLVKSDLNQLGLVGARVALLGSHAATNNSIAATVFNGEFIVIALTGFLDFDTFDFIEIPFPIEITFTKEGFKPAKVSLPEPDPPTSTITRDLVMIADSDEDGIPDAVENASCLNENDADTDDDGIADGDEDTNKNGDKDSGETDPCDDDTDNDGIQDGTERGYTEGVIGHTDTAIFKPDFDPSTKTNPLDDDSDNDGLLDGDEDSNHNGRVDDGETDPNFSNAGALPAILQLLLLRD